MTFSARTIQGRPVAIGMQRRLVDVGLDRYIDWRNESTAVKEAYGRWSNASTAEAALAFAAYRSALNREECAARVYAGAMHDLNCLFGERTATKSGAALR